MRNLSWILAGLMAMPFASSATAVTPAALNLVIVEGEGAINNIRQRTAREPIVQVEDENHKPVAGAVVLFLLPSRGATAEFPGGAHSLSVTTDQSGRAVARGLQPNSVKGSYQIKITATLGAETATAVINQSNAVVGTSAAVHSGISGKVIAIIAVAGAAAAGGAYAATHSGSNNSTTTTPTGTTITAGTGTVGPPR